MSRNSLCIIGYIVLMFIPRVAAPGGGVKETGKITPPLDGLGVMTMVSERERGEDYVISTAWNYTEKGRVRYSMKYVEKRKYYRDRGDMEYKSLIRYTAPPNLQGKNYLLWSHKDRERALWYFALGMTSAQRVTNFELLRSPAETDFNFAFYYDINPGEEEYSLLGFEVWEGARCYVVECTPIKKNLPYGKRTVWVDQQNLTPLKIEYYDKEGNFWKVLTINWQKKDGVWYWQKVVVKNRQKHAKTYISLEDVTINSGLQDREFSRGALQQHNF